VATDATCDLLCLDLPKAERLRAGLPDADRLSALAGGLKALGDPTRLAVAHARLLPAAERECDLSWVVGRDEKLVSHHVRQLRSAGLTRSERRGKMVMYELTPAGEALLDVLAPAAGTAER
jgi:ArsR family transcriptional regulator, lead/cadmium/zinc/bismuth-responsive transcriptional repressor